MTLRTSSRKINPFCNMIGFTLRKNLGMIIVLCIAALVYYPGTFIINYEVLFERVKNSTRSYMIEDFGIAVTVVSTIVAVLFNMINFNFLYKKSSSDVFHAFPLKRSELLISRFLSGIASTLIPTFICYSAFSILMVFNSWMGNFTELLYYLLHNLLIILVCSSFSLIFVISAGSAFDLGISLIGGNLALIAVGAIFEEVLNETLIGYNGYSSENITYRISPPYFCAIGLENASDISELGIKSQNIEFFIRSIIYIALFTAISILLYNHRKAEKGGAAYAYKFMYLGCSLLAGICGGYLLGMMLYGELIAFPFWIFATIGCLLTSVIYGAVTNRGFKGAGKSIIIGVISALILIAVTIVGITGGFGFSTRIPQESKINSATIDAFDEEIKFDNPQKILALHKAIVDTNATEYDENIAYRQLENVTIYYDLKNGKTMSRSFTIDLSKAGDELLKIYKSDERHKMIKELTSSVNTDKITLYFYYNSSFYNAYITYSEALELIDAYWQDVQECDEAILSSEDYRVLELTGYNTLDTYREHYFSFQLEWHDNFTNTKNFIDTHNLLERSNDYYR